MTTRDPVCGMRVNPKTADARLEYLNHTYYFCSEACQRDFQADPDHYLGARGGHKAA